MLYDAQYEKYKNELGVNNCDMYMYILIGYLKK